MLDQIDAGVSLLKQGWKLLGRLRDPQTPGATPATRFIQVFEVHGVHRNQIPRFFGHGLTLADVQDESTLLKRFDEAMLDDLCTCFAVRREWLDGASLQAHPCHSFYKHPEKFVDFIEALLADKPASHFNGLLVASEDSRGDCTALLILQESIGEVGDSEIFRYHLCSEARFDYWRSHVYIAACVAIAWKHKIYVHGVFASQKAIRPFAEGERLLGWHGEGPRALGCKRWDPEYMALEPDTFLKGVDQERGRFGWKAALGLWLVLHDQGFMDIGIDAPATVGARERFQTAYDKY